MRETFTEMTEKIPLRRDSGGAVRIGGTQVTLDVVVAAYGDGATPEQIAQKLGELRLDDVYAVMTYYLRHAAEVRTYLAERERQASHLREKVEANPGNRALRERLLRRKAELQDGAG